MPKTPSIDEVKAKPKANTRPKLSEKRKIEITQRLARYEPPTAIAKSMQELYRIKIAPQSVTFYDPTRYLGRRCPERWADLFWQTRAEFDAAANAVKASRNRLADLFPAEGPLRRELYPKHLALFAAGRIHQERCMIAANRVGKTVAGGYETTLHLTGRYPDWWEGRRFDGPIQAWVAGDTAETTRDIVQEALMGPPAELGTGLIPADAIIGEPSRRASVAGAFDTARIRHESGGVSLLGFKSFDQGRRKFQGTAKHLVWLDEEPPADVYDECMLRLMTTDGLMLCTFTPLEGMTEIVRRFLPQLAGT